MAKLFLHPENSKPIKKSTPKLHRHYRVRFGRIGRHLIYPSDVLLAVFWITLGMLLETKLHILFALSHGMRPF